MSRRLRNVFINGVIREYSSYNEKEKGGKRRKEE